MIQVEEHFEIELDFDEMNDMLDEIKPKITVVESHGASNEPTDEQNVFAGERDSCCGTSTNQHDYALDSTYQSWHLQDMSFDSDPFPFDKSIDDVSI